MLGYGPTGSERIANEYGIAWHPYTPLGKPARHPPRLSE